ncbi:hypothetical protein [Streptomyces sp. NPDC093544]|uniref:hypothetical protein n=1 Tax=Streptomyces sp. NPDC093544 TaxID=3155200 RepID=UPI003442C12A
MEFNRSPDVHPTRPRTIRRSPLWKRAAYPATKFGETRAGDDAGGLSVPADAAQVELDLARELVELTLGGGESLPGGGAGLTVLRSAAGAAGAVGGGRCGHAGCSIFSVADAANLISSSAPSGYSEPATKAPRLAPRVTINLPDGVGGSVTITRMPIALVAVPALPGEELRTVRTSDLDLARSTLEVRRGLLRHTLYLEEFSHRLASEWLAYRYHRWPASTNPYLLVSQKTALDPEHPVVSRTLLRRTLPKNVTLVGLRQTACSTRRLPPVIPSS